MVKWLSLLATLVLLASCDAPPKDSNSLDSSASSASEQNANLDLPLYSLVDYTPSLLDLEDLDSIKERGVLRILVHREERYFPRNNSEVMHEQELAADLAAFLGVTPEFVVVDSIDEVLSALLEGAGDIAIANLTETPERKLDFHFSLPVGHTTERLIANATDTHNFDLSKSLAIGVRSGTTFEQTAERLAKTNPSLSIVRLPPDYDIDQIFDRLVAGDFDLSIQDSNLLDQIINQRTELAVGPAVSTKRATGWVTRKGNPVLAAQVDQYIAKNKLSENHFDVKFRDWAQIKKDRTLRVVTRNRPDSYFIWRGELMGFEYDLFKRFADEHKLRLEILVPNNRKGLLSWVAEGRADISAGFISIDDQVERRGVRYTNAYHKTYAHIVTRSGAKIDSLDQLNGLRVHVHKHSKHYLALEALIEQGYLIDIVEHPNNVDTDELVRLVSEGDIEATVLDHQQFQIEAMIFDNIAEGVKIDNAIEHGWVVNSDSNELREQLNKFLKKEYRGLFYNVTYKKYFNATKKSLKVFPEIRSADQISPYDDIIKEESARNGFDWRLIASQTYQESKFDPNAKSWVGALGLLQVMPRTAKELGYKPSQLKKPKYGIAAGAKYMKWVSERFGNNVDIDERAWFTLAAYNAGIGHVRDARTLARKIGKDPNRWFDQTEQAMLLLSQKKYYKKARYGFVRGHEPVTYVRNIRRRYQAYVIATESTAQPTTALLSCQPLKELCSADADDRLSSLPR